MSGELLRFLHDRISDDKKSSVAFIEGEHMGDGNWQDAQLMRRIVIDHSMPSKLCFCNQYRALSGLSLFDNEVNNPCPVIRGLVSRYRDHVAYRAEWGWP